GLPVVVAGVRVASGDVVVADDDGVVVIPKERLEEVLERLPAIRAAEADMDRRVRDGLRLPPFLDARR
ncbi:MAG TPA: 4-carboxy-4-hydroxy-2-oxoadipate aldolase/oxaloacetate decarboxylase, partial [Burkholderiaceae bacterium]|nr:4-carboxy-4-hydroxy-2-oxoadipate aldolase/oxaloacetate decarboxylase [Burkholderiaceae bacterium]